MSKLWRATNETRGPVPYPPQSGLVVRFRGWGRLYLGKTMTDPDKPQAQSADYMRRLYASQEALSRSLRRQRRHTHARICKYFREAYGERWEEVMKERQ